MGCRDPFVSSATTTKTAHSFDWDFEPLMSLSSVYSIWGPTRSAGGPKVFSEQLAFNTGPSVSPPESLLLFYWYFFYTLCVRVLPLATYPKWVEISFFSSVWTQTDMCWCVAGQKLEIADRILSPRLVARSSTRRIGYACLPSLSSPSITPDKWPWPPPSPSEKKKKPMMRVKMRSGRKVTAACSSSSAASSTVSLN